MQRAVDAALRIFEAIMPREHLERSYSDAGMSLSCYRNTSQCPVGLYVRTDQEGWSYWYNVSTAERLHAFGLLRGLVDGMVKKYPLPEVKTPEPESSEGTPGRYQIATRYVGPAQVRWVLVPINDRDPVLRQSHKDRPYLMPSDAKTAAGAAARANGITIVA